LEIQKGCIVEYKDHSTKEGYMGKKISQVYEKSVFEDGKIKKIETETSYVLNTEDDYIKLYLTTISFMHNLKGSVSKTLNELLKRVGYDNKIVLAPLIKEEISKASGVKKNTVEHHITSLCKSKLLIKEATNVYKINTFLFGRGKWKDIQKHRTELGLNIVFEDGKIIFN